MKKYITNYTTGRKAYTTYRGKQSKQKIFRAGVPQGGVLSPTLFNIYTADIPTPTSPHIKVITYADDITVLSSHTKVNIAQHTVTPYLQNIKNWAADNNLTLNAAKTTATLFTPDPAEFNTQLTLTIDNHPLPTTKNPKILGLTFDPKLTYNSHIQTTKQKASSRINAMKALTGTHWGKQKDTLTITYKTIVRPVIEYACTIWGPITADTNVNKLQTLQNTALRTITGCTQDTNTQHLHDETDILPLKEHITLHTSQLRQKAQHPSHPLHHLTQQRPHQRHKKQTAFDNINYTLNRDTPPHLTTTETIKHNLKDIHTQIVNDYINHKPPNHFIGITPPTLHHTESTLNRHQQRRLAQLRTNKSPLLRTYLHKIDPTNYTSPSCPLCHREDHDTYHLFLCPLLPSDLSVVDLWENPVGAAGLLGLWEDRLGQLD